MVLGAKTNHPFSSKDVTCEDCPISGDDSGHARFSAFGDTGAIA